MTLTDADLERYSRQLVLPEWSGAAQARLKSASAVVVGAGALGSPVLSYLAGAGVGRLGVVDDGEVELSNLPRQPLHFTPDVEVNKAVSATSKLQLMNPTIMIETFPARIEEFNAEAILAGADVVVDCSDTFATRYVVNDACCALGTPLVEGGVLGFDGLVMAIKPGESACYRCAFPTEPPEGSVPSCREAGVLGPVAGVVGAMQALEALKLLTGAVEPALDRIVQIDARNLEQTLVKTSRRPDCTACARVPAATQSG
ncbi:MAG TPA: HesA/MoeB/ThiF family protein [Thermoleophilaceae bacterium]|nr:HesA/MoeB/ThiF family protein [Thermoleophilaceae bacterium]